MRRYLVGPINGIQWRPGRLTKIEFTDDKGLINITTTSIQSLTNNLNINSSKFGFRVSNEGTKAMVIGEGLKPAVLSGGLALKFV